MKKLPELSKEFADAITCRLTSIPTAAKAPEVYLRPDRRLGGILPYREKSPGVKGTVKGPSPKTPVTL